MKPAQVLLTVVVIVFASRGVIANDLNRPLRPDRFAIIFNMGYAGDHLPQDKAAFEKLITAVKQAHFNVVLCKYEDWRGEICKRHGLQMMVDLLAADHHVYKNPSAAEKLCTSLRDNDVVYAYHLWSDNLGNTYAGRKRDVKNVKAWDGTHPVYVGCYGMSRIRRVEGFDLLGYYDFHWQRGGHWGNLAKASAVAIAKDAYFLRYCDPAPGRIGQGNPNRAGFTIATSIPFGLKGYTYHYRGGVVDKEKWQLAPLGVDLRTVNAKFAAIGAELIKLGNPVAVYSTRVTKSAKDRPTGTDPQVPAGLTEVPDDYWFRVVRGEVLLGVFQDQEKNDLIAFASHNAYQPQRVRLQFDRPVQRVGFFNRETKSWDALSVSDNQVAFDVDVFATELVRIQK